MKKSTFTFEVSLILLLYVAAVFAFVYLNN